MPKGDTRYQQASHPQTSGAASYLLRHLRWPTWLIAIAALAMLHRTAAGEEKAADTKEQKPLNYIFIKRAFTTSGSLRHGIEFAMEASHDGKRVGELVSTTFTQDTIDLIHTAIAHDKEGKPPPATSSAEDTEFTLTKTPGGTWNLRPTSPASSIPTQKITIIHGDNIALRRLPEMFKARPDSAITLTLDTDLSRRSAMDMQVTLLPGEYTLTDVLNLFIEQNQIGNWLVRHRCSVADGTTNEAGASKPAVLSYTISIHLQ